MKTEGQRDVVPNILTVLRLAAVPPVLWLAYGEGAASAAAGLGLFLIAAFTDWLDGYIARRTDSITRLGTLLDPLADKILVLGTLFVFADRGLFPLWLVLVVLFRELLVSGVRRVHALEGKVVGANWMGKTKFVTQNLLIVACFLHLLLDALGESWPAANLSLFWGAIAVAALSVGFAGNFLRWHLPHLLHHGPDPSNGNGVQAE